MALAPDAARRDKEDDGSASAGEQVASKDNGVVEGRGNTALETDGIGCEDWSQARRENTSPAQQCGDEVTLP